MTKKTKVHGHDRPVTVPRHRAAWLAALGLVWASSAFAVPPPVAVTQFDMTGYLQAATLSGTDVFAGGTLTVNGQVVTVPRNVVVVMPATYLTWQELFTLAPLPYGPTQTGLAMSDVPAPFVPYEAHVIGNRVGDQYIAGLVSISQQSLNSGQGYINFIDYSTGELRVGGLIGDPTTGQRVRINDPLGKFGRVTSADPRFTIDEDNPTIRSGTGYPFCLPRLNPAVQNDPLCPQSNRLLDAASPTGFASIFTMPDPALVVAGGPDPMLMAPLEVGDFVTYSGTLVKDGTQPSAGPNPSITPLNSSYISAWSIIANVGIFTAPGTNPVYMAIDVTILGTGGVTIAGAAEATIRTRFEGFATDASFLTGTTTPCNDPAFFKNTAGQRCTIIDLYGTDVDPCSGAGTDRAWGSIDVDQGPPFGAVMGRWRFRPPSKVVSLPPTGVFDPPTREVHAVVRGAKPTPTTNGLLAGQYRAPITEYLFPENIAVGSPIVPNNLETFRFLAQGSGPYPGGGPSPIPGGIVGQLSPWPGATPPAPASCAAPVALPPTADAGQPQTVPSGIAVTLDGSLSSDPNGLPLTYAWTQVDTTNLVTLSSPSVARPTFTAPTVPSGSTPVVLHFQLVVSDSRGPSAPASVAITVNPAAATVSAPIASAGANQTVASGSHVVLDGSLSSDPNIPAQALTYTWTQVSPINPAPALTGANTATPFFTAPLVAPGAPLVMTFHLTVTNTSGLGATATVNVTVNPVLAPVAVPGPAQTVIQKALVTLDGSASFDPNGAPLTFQWTQVGGQAVTLTGGTSATPTFTAPTMLAGQLPITLAFTLTVNDGFLSSTPQIVTVTVSSTADNVVVLSAVYRTSKQRLTVTASSSLPSTTLFLVDPQQAAPASGCGVTPTPAACIPLTLQAGVLTAILVGVPEPTNVTVVSNLGGSATSPITRLR
jgi:hypothetical protein